MADDGRSRLQPSDQVIDAWKTAVIDVEVDGVSIDPRELAALNGCPVHVVTAWNPGGLALDRSVNDLAHLALQEQLRSMDVRALPAKGSGATSSWEEPGFAIMGLSRADARALGASFGQVALYEASADEILIVWCASERVISKPG